VVNADRALRDARERLTPGRRRGGALRDARERLTPGHRRGWLLHFNGAKQSKIRTARIERATPQILEGFGMHD
jgi:uncharacterized protein YdeI (YjbR/CyaY-like superfamily)